MPTSRPASLVPDQAKLLCVPPSGSIGNGRPRNQSAARRAPVSRFEKPVASPQLVMPLARLLVPPNPSNG
jgi:hypothetical protein